MAAAADRKLLLHPLDLNEMWRWNFTHWGSTEYV